MVVKGDRKVAGVGTGASLVSALYQDGGGIAGLWD